MSERRLVAEEDWDVLRSLLSRAERRTLIPTVLSEREQSALFFMLASTRYATEEARDHAK